MGKERKVRTKRARKTTMRRARKARRRRRPRRRAPQRDSPIQGSVSGDTLLCPSVPESFSVPASRFLFLLFGFVILKLNLHLGQCRIQFLLDQRKLNMMNKNVHS